MNTEIVIEEVVTYTLHYDTTVPITNHLNLEEVTTKTLNMDAETEEHYLDDEHIKRFNILCVIYSNNGIMKIGLMLPDGTNPNVCCMQ